WKATRRWKARRWRATRRWKRRSNSSLVHERTPPGLSKQSRAVSLFGDSSRNDGLFRHLPHLRSGRLDLLGGAVGVLLEVLDEQMGQLVRLLVVGLRIRPGAARIEHLVRHVRNVLRHHQPEDRILAILHVV